ncbi:unnamed protein product, partial [marine sediment metagenome]
MEKSIKESIELLESQVRNLNHSLSSGDVASGVKEFWENQINRYNDTITFLKGESRFFLDLRGGCGAVRDSKHPNHDPDYQGLHEDTRDVVEYRHGFQNHKKGCWE